jgi:hypothetical protein
MLTQSRQRILNLSRQRSLNFHQVAASRMSEAQTKCVQRLPGQ